MVLERGIKTNSEKMEAILDMPPSWSISGVEKLAGPVAALNRLVSRSTDKCLLLFKVLRKAQNWNAECEEAFTALKKYLTSHSLLNKHRFREVLILYLSFSPQAPSLGTRQ